MGKLLWQPREEQIAQSNMRRFMRFVNERHGQRFATYEDLYQWSITAIPDFWAAIWDFMSVKASRRAERVVDDPLKMPGARWFEGARLNFAENLLRYRDARTARGRAVRSGWGSVYGTTTTRSTVGSWAKISAMRSRLECRRPLKK